MSREQLNRLNFPPDIKIPEDITPGEFRALSILFLPQTKEAILAHRKNQNEE